MRSCGSHYRVSKQVLNISFKTFVETLYAYERVSTTKIWKLVNYVNENGHICKQAKLGRGELPLQSWRHIFEKCEQSFCQFPLLLQFATKFQIAIVSFELENDQENSSSSTFGIQVYRGFAIPSQSFLQCYQKGSCHIPYHSYFLSEKTK